MLFGSLLFLLDAEVAGGIVQDPGDRFLNEAALFLPDIAVADQNECPRVHVAFTCEPLATKLLPPNGMTTAHRVIVIAA